MTAPQGPARPTVVTVLGVIFVVFAALGLVSFLIYTFTDLVTRFAPALPGHLAARAHRGIAHSRQGQLWELYGLAVSIVQLVASIAFLGLRAWGRAVLEALQWLSAALAIGYIVWLASGIHPGPAPAVSTVLGIVGNCAGLAIAGVFLYSLRSKTVREAMQA